VTAALSRETRIGVAVTALAVAAMAVDHLMGDDPAVLEDTFAFAISAVLCVALAAFVFGRLVPRTKAAPDRAERAAKRGLVLSGVAVIAAPLVFWLGLPFVLAGGGVALGLLGRDGTRGRAALAAIALGGFVIGLGAVGYGAQFVDKLR
jgi:hypothetical protein